MYDLLSGAGTSTDYVESNNEYLRNSWFMVSIISVGGNKESLQIPWSCDLQLEFEPLISRIQIRFFTAVSACLCVCVRTNIATFLSS